MKALVLAILIFIGCATDNHDEIGVMNTICIDGFMCLSVMNGLECDYIPVKVNDKKVMCGE